jgi:hypothetical protein
MTNDEPLCWTVKDAEPRRKLLWFCRDPDHQLWVELLPAEVLDNAQEVMDKVLKAITEHCGIRGEIRFGTDSTQYRLHRVELRTNGEIEKTISFTANLVALNPRILVKIITLPAAAGSNVPACVSDRRFGRDVTLEQALEFSERLAKLAATNGGLVVLGDDLLHFLDRVEVYYDGIFQRVYPLDYSHLSLGGQ